MGRAEGALGAWAVTERRDEEKGSGLERVTLS